MNKEFVCGCDVGSTCGKAVIMDMSGTILTSSIVRSVIDPTETAHAAIDAALKKRPEYDCAMDFAYTVGTGYGGHEVPFANENISEISCHAMGVHLTAPNVRTVIDIGGQDIKGIYINSDGSVGNFVMNDKCAAGTGASLKTWPEPLALMWTSFQGFLWMPAALSVFRPNALCLLRLKSLA